MTKQNYSIIAIAIVFTIAVTGGLYLVFFSEPSTLELREQSPEINFLEFEQNFVFVNALDRSESFSGTTDDGFRWGNQYGANIISIFDDDGIHRFDIEIHQESNNSTSQKDWITMWGLCLNRPAICFEEQKEVIYTIHEKTNFQLDSETDHPIRTNNSVNGFGYNDDGLDIYMDVEGIMPQYEYDHQIMPQQTLFIYYIEMETCYTQLANGTMIDCVPTIDVEPNNFLSIDNHELFIVEHPDWKFINNTNAKTDVCEDVMESAYGIYCLNEKPLKLDAHDTVTLTDDGLLHHVETSLKYTIDDKDLFWGLLDECYDLEGTPTIELIQSTHEWLSTSCKIDFPTNMGYTNKINTTDLKTLTTDEKLDKIITMLEFLSLQSLSELDYTPYTWAIENHESDGRICFYEETRKDLPSWHEDQEVKVLECFRP